MNWVSGGQNILWPIYPPALAWCLQLVRQQTRIFAADDPYAADFLADQAIFNRLGGESSSGLELAIVHDLVHRYQGEQVDGIQN
jgi:hypothetical protein